MKILRWFSASVTLRVRVRTLLWVVALAALVLATCRVRSYLGVTTLAVRGRDVVTYYPRAFGGPELAVWKPHDHPASCRIAVYYLAIDDCPIWLSVGRAGVRRNYARVRLNLASE